MPAIDICQSSLVLYEARQGAIPCVCDVVGVLLCRAVDGSAPLGQASVFLKVAVDVFRRGPVILFLEQVRPVDDSFRPGFSWDAGGDFYVGF